MEIQNQNDSSDQNKESPTKYIIIKNVFIAFCVAIILASALYAYAIVFDSKSVRKEEVKVNEEIASMDIATDNHIEYIQQHEQQVVERTVVIRERIMQEARSLPPDKLAAGVLYELELFRRRTSSDISPSSSSWIYD
jgi:hypothetical protein